jgi:hypothetical protein
LTRTVDFAIISLHMLRGAEMKTKIGIVLGIMLIAALACNLSSFIGQAPTLDANVIMTAAAQTIEAQIGGVTQPPVATSTFTVPAPIVPSNTPTVTSTATQTVPCNQATFVGDITIPDGTGINFGQTFTKTWRLQNSGSCTWTSGYSLIFDHGDQMGGPAAQMLTSGTVPPGGTLDVSVNLTTPSAAGTYKGYWRLREPGGVSFGLPSGSSFWVTIAAVSPLHIITLAIPPLLPPLHFILTADLPVVAAKTGTVWSDGGVVVGFAEVGDTATNLSMQGFVTFDLSAIPAGSTISDANLTFSDYTTGGNPWSLSCLRMYAQGFGNVNGADFFTGVTTGALIRWCSNAELTAQMAGTTQFISYIQAMVGNPAIQFRLQLNDQATNSNGVEDMVRFGNGIKITVKYTTP